MLRRSSMILFGAFYPPEYRVITSYSIHYTKLYDDIDPDFAMAVGNRGFGVMHYAKLVHDPGHQVFHLQEAYDVV